MLCGLRWKRKINVEYLGTVFLYSGLLVVSVLSYSLL